MTDLITLPLSPLQIATRLVSLERQQVEGVRVNVGSITAPPSAAVNAAATVAEFGATIPRNARSAQTPFGF